MNDKPSTVSMGMVGEVERRLAELESERGVRILLAVESGSRAWGFPSADSDYDVRFVYVRPAFDYLRLHPPRDVIECPVDGLWDVNGWDLRKALMLLGKGNPSIVEWLRSPIVYRDSAPAETMRNLVGDFVDPEQSARHHHGLLRSHWYNEFNDRETVRLKQYLYLLRASASLSWIRDRNETPPIDLPSLTPALPAAVADLLPGLVSAKADAAEGKRTGRIAAIDAFAVEMMDWASAGPMRFAPPGAYTYAADHIIRAALSEGAGG